MGIPVFKNSVEAMRYGKSNASKLVIYKLKKARRKALQERNELNRKAANYPEGTAMSTINRVMNEAIRKAVQAQFYREAIETALGKYGMPKTKKKVTIEVLSGMVRVTKLPKGVEVTVIDRDVYPVSVIVHQNANDGTDRISKHSV
jgi:hypothetical protein